MPSRPAAVFLLTILSLLGRAAVGQLPVCDGRNHQTTTTTGSWGLPAVRTLGVRFVPAMTLPVERLEWYFAPSILTPALGGTVAILQESAAAQLPSTSAGAVLAQAQWSSAQTAPIWEGGTFATPVLLQAGTPYWLTTTASPTVTHQAPSYEDSGPAPTTYAVETGGTWFPPTTPHRFKVRLLSSACSTGTQYQLNQPEAAASINNVQGTVSSPATPTVTTGTPANFNLSSTALAGAPWDVGVGTAPLVGATAGGMTLSDGQIVNVDFTDPTFGFLFTPPFSGPPFANLNGGVPTAAPAMTSFQMALIDPSTASGFRLSQATRLIVQ